MVPRGVAEQIRIKQRKQLDGFADACSPDLAHVRGQGIEPCAFHRNRDQVVLPSRPRCGADARPRTPPASKVGLRRWTVRPQIPSGNLDDRKLGIYLTPASQPSLRADERDALAAARPEAQATVTSRGLQHSTPPGLQGLSNPRRPALADEGDQLLPCRRCAVERSADVVDPPPDPGLRDLAEVEPRRAAPPS